MKSRTWSSFIFRTAVVVARACRQSGTRTTFLSVRNDFSQRTALRTKRWSCSKHFFTFWPVSGQLFWPATAAHATKRSKSVGSIHLHKIETKIPYLSTILSSKCAEHFSSPGTNLILRRFPRSLY